MKNSGENFLAPVRVYDVPESETPSRLSGALFVFVCVLPIIATLLYGGVDAFFLGLLSLATAAMLVIWIFEAWQSGEFRFSSNLLQAPIAILILLGTVQLLPLGSPGLTEGILSVQSSRALTLDPFATRLFIVRMIAYLVFFAAALTFINSRSRASLLTTSIVIFGSLIAFFGILQRLADPDAIYGIRPTPQAIPFGPFVNQHHFAAFMEMTSGIVFALLLSTGVKRDRKMFLIIAAILMSIAILFTGSRGGVISFTGVLVFVVGATYLLKRGKRSNNTIDANAAKRSFSALAGSAAFLFLIVGLVVYLGAGDSLLRGIGLQQNQADISSGRTHYWQVAFQIFKANPVMGAGLDAFANAFTGFDTSSGSLRVEQAHNDYLQILADGGLIGLASVLAFVWLLFRNGIRSVASGRDEISRSIALGALAGCFGMAIHSFFDFPLRTPSNALYFLLLAVLATTRFSDGERAN